MSNQVIDPEVEYEDVGSIPVDAADSANIPVDIWLIKEDEGSKRHAGMWKLTADNYMPRKSCLSGEASYAVFAKNRATLVALVHKHWLPLYKTAVSILTELKQDDDDGTAQLYYWSED